MGGGSGGLSMSDDDDDADQRRLSISGETRQGSMVIQYRKLARAFAYY